VEAQETWAAGPAQDPAVLVARAHLAAEAAGEDGYLDPMTGFFVFTRARLMANGRCCGSGCRHCPYT
jgi:hypothetical protein